jgi:hypothetical protein
VSHVRLEGSADGWVAEEDPCSRGVSGAWLVPPAPAREENGLGAFGQGGKPSVAQGWLAVMQESGLLIWACAQVLGDCGG